MDRYRRLNLKDGVGQVFEDYVKKCRIDQVYFLASTDDETNPLANPEIWEAKLLPRCCGKEWEETKTQFCWMPN